MFDHLIKENNLGGVFNQKDLKFVKELILCPEKKVHIFLRLNSVVNYS